MAQVIPCIRGKMGSTKYYTAKATARELAHMVRPASEYDTWATWSIEERLQRELNRDRIEKEIVPYLANARDRFFGSVIVLAYKPRTFEFEPIDELSDGLPAAYAQVARDIGFLTVDGGELIMLDGQHRLVALREIVDGNAQGEYVGDTPSDEICVIFIDHETNEKTRRIFNKVNRHAKPTSRGDNIITSEDDGYAIVTRRLINVGDRAPLGIEYERAQNDRELIVNWKSNTITERSLQLTTVSAVYETVKDILAHNKRMGFDEKTMVNRPAEEELDRAYEEVELWWSKVLEGIKPFKEAIQDVQSMPDRRAPDKPYSLLFKPVGQVVLFKGLIRAVKLGVTLPLAVERANYIDWQISADIWVNTIVKPSGRVSTGKASKNLAAELVAYMIAAERMDDAAKKNLKRAYNEARGYGYDLPEEEQEGPPEELPAPVTTNPSVV